MPKENESPSLTDKDVDADIAADWQAILDRQTDEDEEELLEERSQETEREETPPPAAKQPETKEAPRGKNGRFQPRQQESSEPPEQTEQQQLGNQEGRRQWDLTRAPSSWRPTARKDWEKVPESVRAEVYRREEDSARGAQQLQESARFGQSIQRVIDPHRQMIEMEGGTPEGAVQELLRTAAVLRLGTPQQKYQTFATIAQRYGVNLAAFAQQPSGVNQNQNLRPQQQFMDPRVDTLLQNMQQDAQNRARQEFTDTENLAVAWMTESDQQGNPLRPYAGDVVDDMSALIPSVKARNPTWSHAQVMQAAYDQAIWANPEIRQILQAEGREKSAANPNPGENLQRVNGAKRAASVNTPRRASIPQAGPIGSMDDTLVETARTLGLVS